jgi:alpha-L-rhamnosidase
VLDFGQNLTGYPTFKIKGTAGTEIKLECAEILDKNGNFYNDNYRSAKSLVSYVMKDGINEYTPLYTFFGFRYLRVSGLDKVDPSCFKAVVVHSDIRRTGYFKCGHAKLNKLYENIIWGQKGNFLDVPTDCPQRDERLGWTGDAQVFCRTANLNFDCKRFFEKWLRDLALAQYPDGGVPRVIPNAIYEDPNGSVEKFTSTARRSQVPGTAPRHFAPVSV